MTFRGRYYARNGKLYEIVSERPSGLGFVGAEVLDENELGPKALAQERVYWDKQGDHTSERELDLVEAVREGKKIGR